MDQAVSREVLEAFLRSPLSKFVPWANDGSSPQLDFINAAKDYRYRVFRSGNRVGKSVCVIVDCLLHVLGWHPCSKFGTPQRWWVSGLDWDFGIGQVLWPTMKEYIPMELVRSITWRRKAPPALPLSILFKNGSLIEFKSADGGSRKYQGVKLHGCVCDEEHEEDVVEEIKTRLIDYGGYLSLSLTPIRRLRWIQDLEARPYVFCVRASMLDAAKAGIIPLAEVEQLALELPERQRRVRIYGDFVALEGLVYPEFSASTHVAVPDKAHRLMLQGKQICPWPIPIDWPRYAAMDFGYDNPTSVLVAAHDTTKGRLIFYRNYYAKGVRAYVWAKHLQRLLPRLQFPIICDHDAFGRAELEAAGLKTLPARKAIDPGLELVERLLERARSDNLPQFVLVEDGKNDTFLGRCDTIHLRKEMEAYHYAKPRTERSPDRPDRPVKRNDHSVDCARYLCASVVGQIRPSSVNMELPRLRIGW